MFKKEIEIFHTLAILFFSCLKMNFLNDENIKQYFDDKKFDFLMKYIENDSKGENQEIRNFFFRCILHQSISREIKNQYLKTLQKDNLNDKEILKILFFYYLKEDTSNSDRLKYLSKKLNVKATEIEEYFETTKTIPNKLSDEIEYIIGICHLFGIGFEMDHEKTMDKFNTRAIHKGDAKCLNIIGKIFLDKNKEKRARKYFKLSAKQGNAEALFNLGSIYFFATGKKRNLRDAFENFKKSSDLGYYKGHLYTGICYEHGSGVETDIKKTFEYYQLAADQYDPEALHWLGFCEFNGIWINRNIKKGIEILRLSADQGYERTIQYLKKIETLSIEFDIFDEISLKNADLIKALDYFLGAKMECVKSLFFNFNTFHQIECIRFEEHSPRDLTTIFYFLKNLHYFTSVQKIELCKKFFFSQ